MILFSKIKNTNIHHFIDNIYSRENRYFVLDFLPSDLSLASYKNVQITNRILNLVSKGMSPNGCAIADYHKVNYSLFNLL